MWNEAAEFLPTDPAKYVVGTQHGSRDPTEFYECVVADVMTIGIVDRFEFVEIEQEQCRRAVFKGRAAQYGRAALQKIAAVGNAGQRVGQRSFLVPQSKALSRHSSEHIGDAERIEDRLENEEGEPTDLRVAGTVE